MVRAVCLDLMGTLLYDPYREALAAAGVEPGSSDPALWPLFETGVLSEREFLRRFFANSACNLDAFQRVRREGYHFLPGMEALLHALAGLVDRYVASNYPVWIEELRARFALDDCCEGVVASHHLGVRKPDPEFYRLLLDRIGHPPEACLFVDDRAVNCTSAERAGMRAHRFDGVEPLIERLKAEGVDVHVG